MATPIRTNRLWLIVLGVIAILAGIYGLYSSIALTIVSVTWIGILVAIVGGIGLVSTARHGGRAMGWLLAGLYLVGGILIAFDPAGAALRLTLVIAAFLFLSGLFRILWAAGHPGRRTMGLISGLVSLLLAVLLLAHWPFSGLVAIGTFVAVDLLFFGATSLAIGLAAPGPVGETALSR